MKAAIEKVRGNLSTHRITIKEIVQEVLRKSDIDFEDNEDLKVKQNENKFIEHCDFALERSELKNITGCG